MKYPALVAAVFLLLVTEMNAQWVTQTVPTGNADLTTVFFLNRKLGWICGRGNALIRTTDAGASWTLSTVTSTELLTDLFFRTEKLGFAIGGGTISRTTNGGATWSAVAEFPGLSLQKIFFLGKSGTGFITTYSNQLIKTTDGGSTWNAIPLETSLITVFFKNDSVGWGCRAEGMSFNGSIYKTVNGGVAWKKIHDDEFRLFTISGFPNSDTLLCFGSNYYSHSSNGVLLRSFDGGVTWSRMPVPVSTRLFNFFTPDSGRVWGQFDVSIFSTKIVKTTNGGKSWVTEDSSRTDYIYSLSFTDDSCGWAVGSYGLVKRLLIKPYVAPPVLPEEFTLAQNFPNPFNSTTTISFSLPSRSFVSLKIYDALGRAVAVVCSEELAAGTHSHRWNAEGFPSGVYFYRLQAGGCMAMKKLLLLR